MPWPVSVVVVMDFRHKSSGPLIKATAVPEVDTLDHNIASWSLENGSCITVMNWGDQSHPSIHILDAIKSWPGTVWIQARLAQYVCSFHDIEPVLIQGKR